MIAARLITFPLVRKNPLRQPSAPACNGVPSLSRRSTGCVHLPRTTSLPEVQERKRMTAPEPRPDLVSASEQEKRIGACVILDSRELFQGRSEIIIEHEGVRYR